MTTSLSRHSRHPAMLVVGALSLVTLLLTGCGPSAGEAGPPVHEGALDTVLDQAGATGAILVRRASDGAEWSGGGARVDQRFLPASTFKVPNALIILETGVVSDPDTDLLPWDGVERSRGWDVDMSLRMALRRSAVWAYQEWARRVGYERMAPLVASLDYGNGDIGGPDQVDLFWLEGGFGISAREQVSFLERLRTRVLPLSQRSQEIVTDVLVDRFDGPGILRGKTGWYTRGTPNIGWYVGWYERDGESWVFALNMNLDYQTEDGAIRKDLVIAALTGIGAIPAAGAD